MWKALSRCYICRLAILLIHLHLLSAIAMPSLHRDMASPNSMPSSSPSEKPLDQTAATHNQAVNHEDPREDAAPEIFPTALKPTSSRNAASIRTTGTNNPDFEVDWDDEDDPTNPRNWPVWYKGLTIFFISWSTWCVAVYSTSYTTGIAQMQADFHISSEPVVTLGVTSYRKRRTKATCWHDC